MTYIFHREEGWYPMALVDDSEAVENAETNPGTLKVTDGDGRSSDTPRAIGTSQRPFRSRQRTGDSARS